jgi:hypothetical protein
MSGIGGFGLPPAARMREETACNGLVVETSLPWIGPAQRDMVLALLEGHFALMRFITLCQHRR